MDSAALTHPWLQASISKLRSVHLLLGSEISFSKIQEERGGMESVGGSACSEADLDGETQVSQWFCKPGLMLAMALCELTYPSPATAQRMVLLGLSVLDSW